MTSKLKHIGTRLLFKRTGRSVRRSVLCSTTSPLRRHRVMTSKLTHIETRLSFSQSPARDTKRRARHKRHALAMRLVKRVLSYLSRDVMKVRLRLPESCIADNRGVGSIRNLPHGTQGVFKGVVLAINHISCTKVNPKDYWSAHTWYTVPPPLLRRTKLTPCWAISGRLHSVHGFCSDRPRAHKQALLS
jgi:hypothetical protein